MTPPERIVCGIDPDLEGLTAARRAARLAAAGGTLVLVAAVDADATAVAAQPPPLSAADWGTPMIPFDVAEAVASLERSAHRSLAAAAEALAGRPDVTVRTRMSQSTPAAALVETAREERADLVAVGAPATSRAMELVLGGTARRVLHEAPCPVLIGREEPAGPETLRAVDVGVDGSSGSATAARLAAAVAAAAGARLRAVVCRGGHVDEEGLRSALEDLPADAERVEDERGPVAALSASEADLVVVGSRGLHGLRALGSVGERVAHRAGCSVLVAR